MPRQRELDQKRGWAFTSAVVLTVLGMIQLNGVLEAATLGVITVQLVPLFVLYSSFTLLTLALLQLIF